MLYNLAGESIWGYKINNMVYSRIERAVRDSLSTGGIYDSIFNPINNCHVIIREELNGDK